MAPLFLLVYPRCDSGISAFRVSISFDSPSCLVSTASNAVDNWLMSVERVFKPTILTFGSLLRRSDTVTRLSCSGILRWRRITSQLQSIALRTAGAPSSIASHTLKGVVTSIKFRMAPRTAVLSSTRRSQGLRSRIGTKKLLRFAPKNNTEIRIFPP